MARRASVVASRVRHVLRASSLLLVDESPLVDKTSPVHRAVLAPLEDVVHCDGDVNENIDQDHEAEAQSYQNMVIFARKLVAFVAVLPGGVCSKEKSNAKSKTSS